MRYCRNEDCEVIDRIKQPFSGQNDMLIKKGDRVFGQGAPYPLKVEMMAKPSKKDLEGNHAYHGLIGGNAAQTTR